MKKLLLILLLILFIITGCKKEPVINSTPPSTPSPSPILPITSPPPVNPVNNPLKAYAGLDVWVPLPVNFLVLYGFTNHPESTVESYSWKKISGPSSFVIEKTGSKQTKVTNLLNGTYEFELTVSHNNGISAKDTVSIHVYEPHIAGANEFIFKNLQWMCPMGCSLLIENFNLYLANGIHFKVFLKSSISNDWSELLNQSGDKYTYGLDNNIFSIYVDNPDDEEVPVDVKITY